MGNCWDGTKALLQGKQHANPKTMSLGLLVNLRSLLSRALGGNSSPFYKRASSKGMQIKLKTLRG